MQVAQSLRRIGKIEDPEIEETVESNPLGYRNKVVFPLGRNAAGRIKAGYYQKGTHKIINLNECPVQDERLNDLLPVIKADLVDFQIYDETKKTGDLRFLSLRIGQRTNEVLVTLVSTRYLDSLRPLAAKWMEQFPNIAGVCLNINCSDSNKIFGTKTALLRGRGYVMEICSGLRFRISSTAFFQVNTPQAETMISIILKLLNIEGTECIVDGYSGIGTMVLPIAQRYPNSRCLAVDSHAESIECARQNAALNDIPNVQFKVSPVFSPDNDGFSGRQIRADPPWDRRAARRSYTGPTQEGMCRVRLAFAATEATQEHYICQLQSSYARKRR